MDYLDNPERRSAARPSDDTSANSYGFAVASTPSLGCKYRLCCLACALGEPDVEDGDHAGGQRRDAQFPPLSQAADMRASVEVDIGAPKADQLGHPQPCLNREREQGAVAPSSRSDWAGTASNASSSGSVRKVMSRRSKRLAGMASTRAITAACSG